MWSRSKFLFLQWKMKWKNNQNCPRAKTESWQKVTSLECWLCWLSFLNIVLLLHLLSLIANVKGVQKIHSWLPWERERERERERECIIITWICSTPWQKGDSCIFFCSIRFTWAQKGHMPKSICCKEDDSVTRNQPSFLQFLEAIVLNIKWIVNQLFKTLIHNIITNAS